MRYTATIYKANCYIRITDFNYEFCNKVIKPFCKANLFKYGQVKDPVTNKKIWRVTHVFARSNNDKTEYRIPHSLLESFLGFTATVGFNPSRVKVLDEKEISGVKTEINLNSKFLIPRENQNDWINYQLAEGGLKANTANTGNGKANPNSTQLKIPSGWKKMGEFKVNDPITAPDGTTTKVTGVYPQGESDIYRVTFEDGRVSNCTSEHLWKIYDVNAPLSTLFGKSNQQRTKEEIEDNRWRVVETKEIIELLGNNVRRDQLFVPLTQSEIGEDKDLKIEPYTLGTILGNDLDSMTQPISKEVGPSIEVTFVERPIKLKAIPKDYLLSSHQQRLALMMGLMDGSLTFVDNGEITFKTQSKQLASGVMYLSRSLGGIAYTSVQELKSGDVYSVHIKHANPNGLFLSRFANGEKNTLIPEPDLKLRIVSIEFSHKEEATCITVEHPDRLYLTYNFVVTHNTYMALYTAVKLGVRTIITIQPRYVTTWLNDIGKTLLVNKDDVMVWETTDLNLLARNIEEGKIDPKIIILPLTRVVGYLKMMREDDNRPCLGDVFNRIGFGLRIIDEGHESFHEICLSMFYGNPKKTLVLSATLEGDDPTLNKMYRSMIPPNYRLKEAEAEHYIDVKAYSYRICQRKFKLNTVQFGSYSDIAFEQSIIRNKVLLQHYYRLMKYLFETDYLNVRQPGTKCLFFFTLVKTSLIMLDLFRRDFPELDFETFLGSLDKKFPTKYLEHEIIITTPGSCGTGKDIPGLVTVISPHTVFSSQRNKQMIGRLRKIDGLFGGSITPTFVFPVCSDIPKHRECYTKRKEAFNKKQKTFKLLDSNIELV